jgi:hypothetical protein
MHAAGEQARGVRSALAGAVAGKQAAEAAAEAAAAEAAAAQHAMSSTEAQLLSVRQELHSACTAVARLSAEVAAKEAELQAMRAAPQVRTHHACHSLNGPWQYAPVDQPDKKAVLSAWPPHIRKYELQLHADDSCAGVFPQPAAELQQVLEASLCSAVDRQAERAPELQVNVDGPAVPLPT